MTYRNQATNDHIPIIICASANTDDDGLLSERLGKNNILIPDNYGFGQNTTFATYRSDPLNEFEREVLKELAIEDFIPPSLERIKQCLADEKVLELLRNQADKTLKTILTSQVSNSLLSPDQEIGVDAPRQNEPNSPTAGDLPSPKALALSYPSSSPLIYIWRAILNVPMGAILIAEDPNTAISHHLSHSPWLDTETFRLARYERCLRNTLSAFNGLPTLILDTTSLASRTSDFDNSLDKLLEICFLPKNRNSRDSELEQSLGKIPAEKSKIYIPNDHRGNGNILPSQYELYRICQEHFGLSDELHADRALEAENDWVSLVLQLSKDIIHTFAGLDWAVKQIEPILRLPEPTNMSMIGKAQSDALKEDGRSPEDIDPLDVKRAYPLNASEDRRAYHRWLRERHLPVNVNDAFSVGQPRKKVKPSRNPLISVLVPVWKTPIWALERCVGSVLNQTFTDFELILCDDASGIAELTSYLNEIPKRDKRIKTITLEENGGISKATNAALEASRGQFISFLDHDDELELNALESVALAIRDNNEADVIYSDEDKIDAHGERFDPLFKPEWSPDLLLSFAYICHLTTVRRELLMELGGLRSEFDGSQDYDLTLRATEKARQIVHVSEVLYHWRTLPGSAAGDSPGAVAKPWAYTAGLRAIKDALQRREEDGDVVAEPAFPGRYHVTRKPKGDPLVSIIIPFRDEPSLLAICCESLQQNPGYDNFEFILVDNGSELPETFTLLDKLTASSNTTVVHIPGPFNWARINNAAVENAKGDVLLFSNNDIEARSDGWLSAMLGHVTRKEVGAVGARLLYPDGGIQHAGVVVGLGGIAGHVLRGLPGQYPGYNSMAIQTRNCSVVTGACMMTRREVFEKVNGFDENLPVAFNDVDFCLKLREQDYLIVYTPLAELIHHESKSRGHTDDLTESARIIERWGHVIVAGDPYLNKHLSHWRYWCPLSTAQENDRWNNYLETSVLTRQLSWST